MSGLDLERPAALSWDFARDAAAVALLLDAGQEWGLDAPQLLAGTALTADELATGDRLVTARQELRVVRNLRAARPDLRGVELGARYRAESFGVLGFALLSSATVAEAANLALRFIDLSFSFAIPDARIEGETVVVEFDDSALPADVRQFLAERDLTAVWRVLDQLRPGGFPATAVELTGPRPADPRRYRELFGTEPVFDATVDRLTFTASLLNTRLPTGGGAAHTMSEAMCAELVSRRRQRSGIAQEVRVLIAQRLVAGAPMAEVCAALGLGERSLRRRLAAEGTSYQGLLDEVRETLAVQLLDTGLLSVDDVALRLGYAEASSFIVAFKRWRGTTPTRPNRQ
ncbi:AraC family transcriptional regulator [Nocardioides sp. Bht2]|uniref:AraC family transcriptional regulator n=1 Tax=Nocardioides sp. Bht2 TaxID=3392297 RepID=UPI0039B48C1E